MKPTFDHLGKTFITGLLAALPLLATVFIVVWLLRALNSWMGPGSFIGSLLVWLGLDVVESELLRWLIGLALVAGAVFLLGWLVQQQMHGWLNRAVEAVTRRIPGVRQVYDLVRRFVDLVSQRDDPATRSMSPVWLHFGGPGQSAAVLGLLSTPDPVLVNGEPYLGVLVPTAPVPVGGALIYVPRTWVQPAAVGMDGLTSIYVSMGVTSAQHLSKP
jgi:uncharacterized membrane protein